MDAKLKGRRAVSYSRYSSDQQRIESIYEQQARINKHIKESGFVLVQEYMDEAKTGKNDDRKSFKKMIADAENGLFDIIVILNFSRLFRNLYQHLTYKQRLSTCGVKIVSVFENYDETTPEGTLFSNVQLSINQYYSDNLSRMTKNSQLAEAQKCKFMGGRVLYGFSIDPETKRYVINESEAQGVRLIFHLYRDGHNAREIARQLADNGITNRGKPFIPFFHEILKNVAYNGVYQYNRRPKRKGNGKLNNRLNNPAEKILQIADGIPRIIDEITFERVNEMLRERQFGIMSKTKYLLGGKLKCVCGFAMAGAYRYSGTRKNTLYFSYRCNCRRSKLSPCGVKDLKLDSMDEYVLDYLRKLLLGKEHGKLVNFINKQIRAANGTGKIDPEVIAEIEQIDATLDNLIKAMDGMTESIRVVLSDEIEKLSVRKCELEGKRYQGIFYTEIPQLNPDAPHKCIDYYRGLLQKDDYKSRKEAVRDLVKRITVSNETITITVWLNALIGGSMFQDVIYDVAEQREPIMSGRHKIVIR